MTAGQPEATGSIPQARGRQQREVAHMMTKKQRRHSPDTGIHPGGTPRCPPPPATPLIPGGANALTGLRLSPPNLSLWSVLALSHTGASNP